MLAPKSAERSGSLDLGIIASAKIITHMLKCRTQLTFGYPEFFFCSPICRELRKNHPVNIKTLLNFFTVYDTIYLNLSKGMI